MRDPAAKFMPPSKTSPTTSPAPSPATARRSTKRAAPTRIISLRTPAATAKPAPANDVIAAAVEDVAQRLAMSQQTAPKRLKDYESWI